MYRGKSSGNKDEDGAVVQPLHDKTGNAAAFHHVIHAAHGQEEHAGEGENAEKDEPRRVSQAAAKQIEAQHHKHRRRQQVRQRADRIVKTRQRIKIAPGKNQLVSGEW